MDVLRDDDAVSYGGAVWTSKNDGYSQTLTLNPFSSLSLLRGFINEAIRETVASNRWRDNNEDTYRIVAQLRYAASEIDRVIASGVYAPNSPQD